MKKWKIILPSLIATASLPLASLVGCGNQPGPEPVEPILKIVGLDTTMNGYANVSGKSDAFSIVLFDGSDIVDVTKDAEVSFTGECAANLSWIKEEGKIAWNSNFEVKDYTFKVTASYEDKIVESDTITLKMTEYKGELYFANVTTEATTYWGESGASDEILLYWEHGKEIINVTDSATFEVSDYSDYFKVQNKRLTWKNNVVPGTYNFTIKAKYNGIEQTSDLLTIHAEGTNIKHFDYVVDEESDGITIRNYKNDLSSLPDGKLYLPNTCIYNGKTYPITSLAQSGSSPKETFSGVKIVYLNEGMKKMGDKAIYGGNESLLSKIYLPSNLEDVGDQAFDYCPRLTDIYYPKTLENWIMNVNKASKLFGEFETKNAKLNFDDIDAVTQDNPRITFNKTDKSNFELNYYDDNDKFNVKQWIPTESSSILPISVQESDEEGKIKTYTFAGIETNAFIGDRLKILCIPSTLENISSFAINACSNLEKIYFLGTIEQWNNVEKGTNWITIPVPIECMDGTIPV